MSDERAGHTGRAMYYYERAAEVAKHVSASEDAIRLLRRALELLQTFPAGLERDSRELKLQFSLPAP